MLPNFKPVMERVQALADILCSGYVVNCHSNETCSPIANPPNSAQLEGTPTTPQHPGPFSSVGMRLRTRAHTHTQTHTHRRA